MSQMSPIKYKCRSVHYLHLSASSVSSAEKVPLRACLRQTGLRATIHRGKEVGSTDVADVTDKIQMPLSALSA
ncbi:MAG TPA: hypothetical protein PLS30_05865, partial [Flavobacteriales bacterium]|nr:hypothetical protein [Flavobacteriales bacterium]HQW98463.1 hypothetical protein [Flavobacteriales bacterium]